MAVHIIKRGREPCETSPYSQLLRMVRKDDCSKLTTSLEDSVTSGPKDNLVSPFLKMKSHSRAEDVAQLVEYLAGTQTV